MKNISLEDGGAPYAPSIFLKRVEFQSDIQSNVSNGSRVRKGRASPFSPNFSFSCSFQQKLCPVIG